MSYGYIFPTEDVKEQLKRLNKNYEGRQTWGSNYAALDLSRQRSTNQAAYDYADAVNQAYASALNQKSKVNASALGTGFKDAATSSIDAALQDAYDSYKQNYLTQVSNVNTSIYNLYNNMDTAFSNDAQNISKYMSTPYDYLSDLYNRAYGINGYENVGEDATLKELFTNDSNWNRYIVDDKLVDKSTLMLDMYDANQNITNRGIDFYDQMLNSLSQEYGSKYSYSSWLANNNPELYEWSQRYNPYNYQVDDKGRISNLATVRTLMGLTPDDARYQISERAAGLTDNELTKILPDKDGMKRELDELYSAYKTDGSLSGNVRAIRNSLLNDDVRDEFLSKYSSYYDEYINNAKKLGVYDKLGEALGGWGNIAREYKQYIVNDKRNVYTRMENLIGLYEKIDKELRKLTK